MSRVIADMLDGEVRRTVAGDTVRRVFQVRELTGAGASRLVKATTASGVPRVGDAHPALPRATVTDVVARPMDDPTFAMVDVYYSSAEGTGSDEFSGWQVDIIQSQVSEVTYTDVNGDPLRTRFTYQSATLVGSQTAYQTISAEKRHRVEVQRPTFSLRFTREQASFPFDQAVKYAGTVNAGTWQGRDADQWLCAVSSAMQTTGRSRVTYEFALNTEGWQTQLVYSAAGEIPTTVTNANGEATGLVYRRLDFNQLGLPRV